MLLVVVVVEGTLFSQKSLSMSLKHPGGKNWGGEERGGAILLATHTQYRYYYMWEGEKNWLNLNSRKKYRTTGYCTTRHKAQFDCNIAC